MRLFQNSLTLKILRWIYFGSWKAVSKSSNYRLWRSAVLSSSKWLPPKVPATSPCQEWTIDPWEGILHSHRLVAICRRRIVRNSFLVLWTNPKHFPSFQLIPKVVDPKQKMEETSFKHSKTVKPPGKTPNCSRNHHFRSGKARYVGERSWCTWVFVSNSWRLLAWALASASGCSSLASISSSTAGTFFGGISCHASGTAFRIEEELGRCNVQQKNRISQQTLWIFQLNQFIKTLKALWKFCRKRCREQLKAPVREVREALRHLGRQGPRRQVWNRRQNLNGHV